MNYIYSVLEKIVSYNESILEKRDHDLSDTSDLITFDHDGYNLYNPFYDVTVYNRVDPINEYGKNNLLTMIKRYNQVTGNILDYHMLTIDEIEKYLNITWLNDTRNKNYETFDSWQEVENKLNYLHELRKDKSFIITVHGYRIIDDHFIRLHYDIQLKNNPLKLFLEQLADREEEFGDLGVTEYINNELLPNIDKMSSKELADKFFDYHDNRQMND